MQSAQQFCIHHTNLVDNQILTVEPQIRNFLAHDTSFAIFLESDRTVQSLTTDLAAAVPVVAVIRSSSDIPLSPDLEPFPNGIDSPTLASLSLTKQTHQ